MLLRIPLLRGLYSTVKDIGSAVLGIGYGVHQVVLVPFLPGRLLDRLATSNPPLAISDPREAASGHLSSDAAQSDDARSSTIRTSR